MLESRSAYGYYGEFGGATGEIAPKTHKSGWTFGEYVFKTNKSYLYSIKACDYEHALNQTKTIAKKENIEFLGVVDTYGVSAEEKQNIKWYREEQR